MSIHRVLFSSCLVLFALIKRTDGLLCYQCSPCGTDPFNATSATVTNVTDNQGYYCIKSSIFTVVSRGASQSCTGVSILGNGVWCCQTDYCNDANRLAWGNAFISAVIIGVMKMFL